MNRKSLLSLAVCLAISHSAGLIGLLLARRQQPEFYRQLRKPTWSPPAKVFGPVWSLLYTLMGIAVWLLWRDRDRSGARAALTLYGTQLALNSAWTPIFFGLRKPRAAFYELTGLWAALLATTLTTFRVNRKAGLLLVPYLAWTTFALALNKRIVDLNPARAARQPAASAPEALAHAPG